MILHAWFAAPFGPSLTFEIFPELFQEAVAEISVFFFRAAQVGIGISFALISVFFIADIRAVALGPAFLFFPFVAFLWVAVFWFSFPGLGLGLHFLRVD